MSPGRSRPAGAACRFVAPSDDSIGVRVFARQSAVFQLRRDDLAQPLGA